MGQDLLAALAPRLRDLDRGGYAKAYRSKSSLVQTGTYQLLRKLLDELKIKYDENVPVGTSRTLRADFSVNGTLVFVDRELSPTEQKTLAASKADSLFLNRDNLRSDRSDHGIRVLGLEEKGDLQTIFLDDPSFNFDYAHILPKTQKCSVMHGHTSSALVEVIGHPVEGMVVDFGLAKQIVREAIGGLDHKLFINEKYVTRMDPKSVTIAFETVHGPFAIRAPKGSTVLLEGEATVENLAKVVLKRVADKMPENVTAVGVYVYEGLNKGSHILAQIHSNGAGKRRRKR
ncbi:MAG: 6-carboxytetrahydropterin synthase [Thaumarchaeota archaeon]|nr:6-carboxytetrahydropterin synthase [Nitrososphaerota archaeon]